MKLLRIFRLKSRRKFHFLGRAGFTFQDGDKVYRIDSEMLFSGPYDIAVFPDGISEFADPAKILDKPAKREIGARAVAELKRAGWKVYSHTSQSSDNIDKQSVAII